MKTQLVHLTGDIYENFYQLGLREKNSFEKIETRIKNLYSTSPILRIGYELISRTKITLKKESSFFNECLSSYAQGLNIDVLRVLQVAQTFELAARYGQAYPELKSFLPGCTSVLLEKDQDLIHARILDFPIVGIFEESPQLYLWEIKDRPSLLTYSCEGMAPFFFQGIHGSGMSFALHHKPGNNLHSDGKGIFQIMFEGLFESTHYNDFKKYLKTSKSMTKWSIIILNNKGTATELDLDGPVHDVLSFNVHESKQLIFTNIPIKDKTKENKSFIKFCQARENWTKKILAKKSQTHLLDQLTSLNFKNLDEFHHPTTTLSSVGAIMTNLTKGYVDLKEGTSSLTSSDSILRLHLDQSKSLLIIKKSQTQNTLETAWKRASLAQASFDQGDLEKGYHELQMSISLMPESVWREIFKFFLCVWDFKHITNTKELSLIYQNLKKIQVPDILLNQWKLMLMRFERKLNLCVTIKKEDLTDYHQELFELELKTPQLIFSTWMNLLAPRLDILDILTPHYKD